MPYRLITDPVTWWPDWCLKSWKIWVLENWKPPKILCCPYCIVIFPGGLVLSIVRSLRAREIACSASDLRGLNFESCVRREVSSHSSHHPQEVLLTQFSLYVDKSGLRPDSFHFDGPVVPADKRKRLWDNESDCEYVDYYVDLSSDHRWFRRYRTLFLISSFSSSFMFYFFIFFFNFFFFPFFLLLYSSSSSPIVLHALDLRDTIL